MNRDWSKEADTCDEFVLSAYKDYSVDTVARLLFPTGLLIDKSVQYAGIFEKYVFLHGNKEEVYSREEIDFISAVGEIAIFTEFFKETRRGGIPCRVVAVRNTIFNTLDFSIAFTKIINKASDGFNICVVVAKDGIVFSCRTYDGSKANNCYISDFITSQEDMKKLYDDLMYSPDFTSFIEYYVYVRECIRFKMDRADYSSKLRVDHWSSHAYIEKLQEIEAKTGLSFSKEIERCFWEAEEERKTFADRVAEAEEYLFKIESSQVNTMELLFEAEEMEKLTSEVEQRNATMLQQSAEEDEAEVSDVDTETKALLEDPEEMIKLLKKKRGI